MPGSVQLLSEIQAATYQWQVDTGNGFINISNDAHYNGATADTLKLTNIPSSWTGFIYHCVVPDYAFGSFVITFQSQWTGLGGDSAWENPANWTCVPDKNTDVIINTGTVILSSNASVRSLTVSPNASFTIVSPFNLIVTH